MSTCTRILILSLFFSASLNAYGAALPENFMIEGRLYDTAGAPIAAAVDIELEVYAQGAPTCVLYREIHQNVNVDSSTNNNNDGIFAVKLGDGNVKPGSFASVQLSRIFGNSVALNGDSNDDDSISAECSRTTGDLTSAARYVRVSVKVNGSASPFDALSPDSVITSVPSAMVAESLQGVDASGFVKVRDDVSTDLNQTNIENIFSATNFAKLVSLLSGSFGNQTVTNVGTPSVGTDATNKNYVDGYIGGKVADASAVGPAAGNGYTLIWDQTLNRWVTGLPSTLDATKLPLAGGTMTGTLNMGAQTLHLGNFDATAQTTLETTVLSIAPATHKGKIWFNTTTNTTMVWNGSASVALAPGATGSAGGDLTGTYPNPDIASGVVGTAELTDGGIANADIANGAISSAKINNTGIAVNRLLMTDATTGATVEYKTCALDESLKWTATGWACTTAASFLGNSGVTAATYGNANQVAQVQLDAQGRATSAANVNIAFPVVSVAGKTGAVTLNTVDVSGLGTAAVKNFGTAAGELVELDGGAKIPVGLLPSSLGDIQDVSAGSGLVGGASSGSATLSVDTGVTTGKIVQMAASDRLPAVDGSNLTQINAVNLQARAVSASAPTAAQVLTWNAGSSAWEPQTLPAGATGDITSVSAGTGTTGGGLAGDVTIGVDVGVTTGKIVQMQASNKLPAVDGSDLTQINAVRLQSRSVASTAPTSSQMLAWNASNSSWEPQTYSVASGGGFVMDGNSFGAIPTFGTNDNFALNLESNGSTAMTILPTGNVGVGTTNPLSLLHVNGVVRATDICDENGANCKDISGGWGAGGDIDGVIAGSGLSGSYVSGTGTLSVDVGVTTGKIVQMAASNRLPAVDGSNLTNLNVSQISGAFANGGNSFGTATTIGNNDNFKLDFETNGTSAMTISPTGNVGIGIGAANPVQRLHVLGVTALANTDPADTTSRVLTLYRTRSDATAPGLGFGVGLEFGMEGFSDGSFPIAANMSTVWRAAQTNDVADRDAAMVFSVMENNSSAERMRIEGSGRVGIGTTTPTATLHLKAGTTLANSSPLKFTTGANMTTPENGAVEFDGTDLFLTTGGTRRKLAQISTANDYAGIGSITGSGALTVATGGTNNALTLTSIGTTGAVNITAGTGSGVVNLNPGSTGSVNVNSTVPSTSSTTGALVVGGGLGVAGGVNAGGFVAPTTTPNTPSYSFNGDPNTGVYSNGPDTVGLVTNGQARLFVDSAGNIGVGTTSPTSAFAISKVNQPAKLLVETVSASAASQGAELEVSSYGLETSFTPAAFSLNSYRGAKGGTTAIQSNDLLGRIGFGGSGGGGSQAQAAAIEVYATSNFAASSYPGKINFLTTPVGTSSALNRMTIDSNGWVGVGVGTLAPFDQHITYSPANANVSIGVATQGTQTNQTASVNLYSLSDGNSIGTSAGNRGWQFKTFGNAHTSVPNQNDLQLGYWNGAAWSTPVTIDAPTGFVGIGNTSPAAALDVTGMIQSSGFARLGAAYTIPSSTALVPVTGMSVNLTAGRTYAFEINLYLTSGAAAGGVRVDLSGGTATATSIIGDAVLVEGTTFRNATRVTALNTLVCAFTTASTTPSCKINGTITAASTGTFMIRFAQNVANATPSGVAAGSTIKFFQVQ